MGKANFSHLASQNILLLIVLIIILFDLRPGAMTLTSDILILLLLLVGQLSQKCEENHNVFNNNKIRYWGSFKWGHVVTQRHTAG